jgi:aminopeptidase N
MRRIVGNCLAGFAIVLLGAGVTHAQTRFAFDETPGTLPKDVVPSDYRLALDLDPAKDRFSGVVDIAIDVRRATDAVVVNAFDLMAQSATLRGTDGPRALTVTEDKDKRQWRLADGRAIAPGNYSLRIAYSGNVHVYGQGLYRVAYTAGGKPAKMLATQMEPIAARTVFPGFDEPAFRATFALSVSAPSGYEVVSNMPVRAREAQGDLTLWHFPPTPPMASYLVTVSVGEFDALEDSADGIPLRILTARGKRDQARYAMAATKRILPFYRDYFGIAYMLPKLDQLAIPGVRGGAMEDWGAISYNESLLLYDAARSSIETKQRIFGIVAHEIAHQWFGNLVTAASWDEIWLNEAFATWMARKATSRFNPDWQQPLMHMLWQQHVMHGDAGPATRAIRSGPVVETAVFDVFDGVTYVKGGAVLEMLETYIGPQAFRRGLNAYFEGQKYSNATAGDLWFYMSGHSGKDVSAIARSWTDQPGYPLLQAAVSCAGKRQTLALGQERFSTLGSVDDPTLWQVPVSLAGAPRPARLLLVERKTDFAIGPCTSSPWYIDSSAGFFHVQYAPEHRAVLTQAFAQLPASERMALLVDTLALAVAGRLAIADYVALAERLRPANDAESQVLYIHVATTLAALDRTLAGTPAQRGLRAYASRKLAPMLARVGWNADKSGPASLGAARREAASDGAAALRLRKELIDALGRLGDEPTLRKSAELYAAERDRGLRIEPSIRPAVIANVARRADADTYADLVARMLAAESVEERSLYASALAQVGNVELAKRYLALSLDDALPPELASSLPGMLAEAPEHSELAYAFVRDNFEALAGKKSEWGRAFMLPRAASSFNDEAKAAVLLADQKRLVGAAGERAARERAADIEVRSRVRSRNGAFP